MPLFSTSRSHINYIHGYAKVHIKFSNDEDFSENSSNHKNKTI